MSMFKSVFFIPMLSILFFASPLQAADYSALLGKFGINKSTTLNDTKIGSGLKEALRVGIDKTVQLLSKPDGYYKNDLVKIGMPSQLKSMEGILRKVGLGSKLDEFELSMNRAAESAAPKARDIFIEAIASMSIDDAKKLLEGKETAATDYFKSKTYNTLAQAYKPIVAKTMSQYGVTSQYQGLVSKYKALPFASVVPAFDAEQYVVTKSLDGLFYMVGKQEQAIRKDPAARATDLLKQVFGTAAK